jgi:hypothetical protein
MKRTRPITDCGMSLADMEAFSLLAFGHKGAIGYDFQATLKHVKVLRDAVRAECPDYEEKADFEPWK